ncbi:MAG: DNA repair protein RecN [Firmicutes bacterium]|nr:DNA repair protein RecN [Bacillota bacterium]
MLRELNIKNFAIIDELNLNFTKGFNVLTGETGAGKSIIIDAVGLALGGRSTKEFVRTGKDKAVIEALFDLKDKVSTDKILLEFGIEREPDGVILLTREIHNSGRSTSRINGRTVTLNMLRKLTKNLVDIHGQHEHQSLLSWENHIKFVDSFGDEKLKKLKQKINEKYTKFINLEKNIKKLSYNDMERERKIDLLKFQLEEINEANLEIGEEEKITKKYNVISNTEEIVSVLDNITRKLNYSDFNQNSIIDNLNNIAVLLNKIINHDESLSEYHENIQTIIYQLQDIARDLRDYSESIEFNPEKLSFLDERINLINRLKRKYGTNIKEILDYRDEIAEELDNIENNEKDLKEFKKEVEIVKKELNELCDILTEYRKKVAKKLEKNIIKELKSLNMKDVTFKINFDEYGYYTKNGKDKIEFLISTNPGEPLKSLSKIVSGGEMSRIMLALKSILAEVDDIPSLIFDEIDTGISGRTAQIVGEKIAKISFTHQILCITHLPQIAAMADNHFHIDKSIKKGKTITDVKILNYEQRINELSRLLGGVDLTSTTKLHAKEMIDLSKKIKSS